MATMQQRVFMRFMCSVFIRDDPQGADWRETSAAIVCTDPRKSGRAISGSQPFPFRLYGFFLGYRFRLRDLDMLCCRLSGF
ncbi:unnamed protein product [Toxocara canis]|uniref:Secreted protein n=1 Tax=Toxocara canis TaxID=6265 RepID=A0A183UCM3_TOXCA|nr:unnamed protein product [Toxocara canis]